MEFAKDRKHGTEKLGSQDLTAQMVINELTANEITVRAKPQQRHDPRVG